MEPRLSPLHLASGFRQSYFCHGLLALILASVIGYAEVPDAEVLWWDFDMETIPEPQERQTGYYEAFFEGQIVEQTKRNLDIPRWVRLAIGRKKPATNVNALDEVPNSSWYTNRHHLRKMSVDELVRGPNQGVGPDLSRVVVTKAKTEGVTPGLQIEDAKGDTYLIKFDNLSYPELQSGAEVIATKILYAAGYNVPENYVAFLRTENLQIEDDVEVADPRTGEIRPLNRDDLHEMLRRAAKSPDGQYRVLASRMLSGKPKGPFAQIGFRADDPNDLIPHEHRRELRGLRVISSWINHWDMKEANSIDMYVEENGRKFLRHYLIDFGSTLGAAKDPTEYFHGREYLFDPKSITMSVFTLGMFRSAHEKSGLMISPAVGMFTADDFDPEGWDPTFPLMAFDNMTQEDAHWATRIILSFTEADLSSIVETAQFSDPKDTDYIVRTLLERRAIIARHWLGKDNALANFSIHVSEEGITVKFRDILVDRDLAHPEAASYTYQVKSQDFKSQQVTARTPEFLIERKMLGAAIERARAAEPIEILVWTNRRGLISQPVRLDVDWSAGGQTGRIRRISRS